jgi:hypothetical protein
MPVTKFDQHIAQCQEVGCKEAFRTGTVDDRNKLCPQGRFELEKDESLEFKRPRQ